MTQTCRQEQKGVTMTLQRPSISLSLWVWCLMRPSYKMVSCSFCLESTALQVFWVVQCPRFSFISLYCYRVIFCFKVCMYKQGFLKGDKQHLQILALSTYLKYLQLEVSSLKGVRGEFMQCYLLAPLRDACCLHNHPKATGTTTVNTQVMTPISVSIPESILVIQFHTSQTLLNSVQLNFYLICWCPCTRDFSIQRIFTFKLCFSLAQILLIKLFKILKSPRSSKAIHKLWSIYF